MFEDDEWLQLDSRPENLLIFMLRGLSMDGRGPIVEDTPTGHA
jgi:hypothetical protein